MSARRNSRKRRGSIKTRSRGTVSADRFPSKGYRMQSNPRRPELIEESGRWPSVKTGKPPVSAGLQHFVEVVVAVDVDALVGDLTEEHAVAGAGVALDGGFDAAGGDRFGFLVGHVVLVGLL
ncbi:hypothetical protein BDK88_2932 [Natrinema hispanicum]|uniref:Uncharacterized protein n=1 Tax=Natrinema hispanicum TaxID=392421 RepID=A0A482YBP4_9EURY|nr:hypothetical protein BDK88_2932 [Natrinema hispanicum]